jgi:hypothetical protein
MDTTLAEIQDMTSYWIEALTARLRRLRHILWSAAGQFSTGEIPSRRSVMPAGAQDVEVEGSDGM